MWDENLNRIYHGQRMNFNHAGPQPLTDNTKTIPPLGVYDRKFLDESSRKRKATGLDQLGSKSFEDLSASVRSSMGGAMEYHLPRGLDDHHKVGEALSGTNVQGNMFQLFPNQNVEFTELNDKGPQFGRYQFYNLNSSSMNFHSKDGNFQKLAVENMDNFSASKKPCSFHHNKTFPLSRSPVGGIPTVPDPQNLPYDMGRQIGAKNFQSYTLTSDGCMEKAQAVLRSKGEMNLRQGHHYFSDESSVKSCSMPFESLTSLQVSQLRSFKSEKDACYVDGGTYIQELGKLGSAVEVKQKGPDIDVARTSDISIVSAATSQISACTEGKEAYGSYQYPKTEVISGSSPSGCGKTPMEDGTLNSRVLAAGDCEVNTVENLEGSNMDDMKHSFRKEISPENGCISAVVPVDCGDDPLHSSNKLDGMSKVHSGKVPPPIIDKLWDGSLQLNASTTVSAVAFFKSGEKAPEVNWTKLVEVKGKVRLEAFENFIQELPRSRSRALMVISLCWKVGSSKTGLKGMKEVAKGYKEKEKVGFANLSQGIDVYVCPRSDTIITILAKYGFFKGMAAVEDDQDSLIGCVVWRRNRTSSNSVSKKSERKVLPSLEQPINSPSETTISQSAETTPLATAQESEGTISKPCVTQTDGSSSPNNPVTRSAAFESTRSLATDSKNTQSRKNPINGSNPFVNTMPIVAPLVPNSPPVISMGQPSALKPDSSSSLDPTRGLLKVEVPILQVSEHKTPHTLADSILPEQSQVLMEDQQRPAGGPDDDDDLPEFDFSTACGLSQQSVTKPLLSSSEANFSDAPFGKKLPVEGINNASGPAPVLQFLTPTIVINQQRPESSTFAALAFSTSQGMPPPNRLGEHQTQALILPSSENKLAAISSERLNKPSTVKQGSSSSGVADSIFSQKNRWDDDDDNDMPEWCPPDLDHWTQSPATTTVRPPIPSPMPRPASEKVPSHPFIPSQSPAYAQPPMPPQFFPHGYKPGPLGQHTPSNTAMPVQARPGSGYVQLGSNSSPGFTPNMPSRPRYPVFDVRPHIRPSDWKLDWRS